MKPQRRSGRRAGVLPRLLKLVTPQQIRAVTRFLESLAAIPSEELIGNCSHGAGTSEDPIVICLREHPVLGQFRAALYRNSFIQVFGWPSWHQQEGWRYVKDSALLKSADLETCIKLLTVAVRADRFSEGHLAAMVRNGHVPAVLARLRELA